MAASAVTRAAAIAALIVVLGAVAAAVIAGSHRGGQSPARTGNAPGARAPGPAGVAVAYGLPIQCLAVTVATVDPHYARADPNRARACGRYDGTMMAIFERVDGAWRPVLTTTSYRCPVAALPIAVQNELAVCPSTRARR